MRYRGWRGGVGVVNPTMRPGVVEELIRLLPEGIAVLPLFLGISRGTTEEFATVIEQYEERVKILAEAGVDLIFPDGAPPFMLKGPADERAIVERWQDRYGVPIVTAGIIQRQAMQALGLRSIVGVTYFPTDLNEIFASYFQQLGVDVVDMVGVETQFDQVQWLSPQRVYAHARAAFLRHDHVDGIYLLGSGWRVLNIVEQLEADLGRPVLHPVAVGAWAIQRRLHVHRPIHGYGRLLEDMPEVPEVS